MRRSFRVPVLLTFGGLAWAGAHWVAHRAASGPAEHGIHGTESPGTLGYVPTSLALCLSLAVVLAATASLGAHGRTSWARSLWLFAAVPMLGLGGELLSAEIAPFALALLAIQVAVALVAARVGRGVLGLVESLVDALAGPLRLVLGADGLASPPVRSSRVPASRRHLGGGQRAPPALSRA